MKEKENDIYEEFFEQLMVLFVNSLAEFEYENQVVLGLKTEIDLPQGRVLKLSIEETHE